MRDKGTSARAMHLKTFLKESKGRGVGTITLIDRDGSKEREMSQSW